jgi:hypothetical protein
MMALLVPPHAKCFSVVIKVEVPIQVETNWQSSNGRAHLVVILLFLLQVQAVVSNPMLQLHQMQAAVLGPIITLGSVELPAVAVLLSAYLGRELQQLVCLAENVKGHVFQALGQG